MKKWWHWDWDYQHLSGELMAHYSAITRWRRGWFTLYKMVCASGYGTEWRLYMPFNFSIGVQLKD